MQRKSRAWIAGLLLSGSVALALPQTSFADTIEVNYGMSGNPSSFDPPDHTGSGAQLIKTIFSRLVRYAPDADKLTIEPDLAESWSVSDDGMTWTFNLRKDVKFHDGTPFNAAAVVHYFDRAVNGPPTSKGSPLFGSIVKSAEAVDDHTVKINMVAPHAFFLNRLCHEGASIYSPTAFEKLGDQFPLNPVGTGPFKFVEFVSGDRVVLEANPDYWRGKPKVDRVVARIVRDSNARALQIESGQLDVAQGIPEEYVSRLEANKGVVVSKELSVNGYRLTLNTSLAPFDNILVRQALNHAVDRLAIAEALYGSGAVALNGPLSPLVMGSLVPRPFAYDPEYAKELLKKAGYENGFSFTVIAPSDESRLSKVKSLAEALRSDFAKIGVDMKIEIAEWAAIDEMARLPAGENKVQATFETRPPATGDASWVFDSDLRSTQIPPKGGNRSFYASDVFDALLDTATASSNDATRDAYLRAAQLVLVEDAPWVFLVTPTAISAQSAKLKNWVIDPVGGSGGWPSEETHFAE